MDKHIAECLDRKEVGDAELFMELLAGEYCYSPSTHTWYKWGGHYWQEAGGALSAVDAVVKVYEEECKQVKRGEREKLEKRVDTLNTYRRRVSVIKLVEAKMSQQPDIKWDARPWLLPCVNGVVDLKTGELIPGNPEYYHRTYCPTSYLGLETPCPRWEEFVEEIIDENQTLAGYLRRLVGYTISGRASEGVFPVLWGRGRNGKGTMLEVLGKVLGGLATPVAAALLLEQTYTRNSNAPSPDLMRLQGKRMVWATETDEGRKLSASLVKWLVGGDSITARPLYGKEISFRPTHTLFLLTNHKPEVDASDYAIWQRVHLIPFHLSYVDNPTKPNERKRDIHLWDKLMQEASGILAWAVRGCLEWQKYGLIPPKSILDTTTEYIREEDTVGEFLQEETVAGEGWTKGIDLYRKFYAWTSARGLPCGSSKKFGKDIAGKVGKRRMATGNEYSVVLKGKM